MGRAGGRVDECRATAMSGKGKLKWWSWARRREMGSARQDEWGRHSQRRAGPFRLDGRGEGDHVEPETGQVVLTAYRELTAADAGVTRATS